MSAKCKKCRAALISDSVESFKTAHGSAASQLIQETCESVCDSRLHFLDEDHIPEWMSKLLDGANWTRGKIHCPNCAARVGSFDFTAGLRCSCSAHPLPALHLIKSKVDFSV